MKPQEQEENENDNPNQGINPYVEFELETFKALLDDRTILFNDVVNKSIIERVVIPLTALAHKSNQPIQLLINSPGGSVEDGQMVVDAIISSPAPVVTIALGQAMSAAFDIFIAGDKRIVYPNTILMMHSGATRFETMTLPQHNVEADLHKRYFERWSTWYASRTNISKKEWLEMLSTGLNHYFFPEDALKHGITHEIIQPITKPTLKKKFKL
jgi:ATP-dependent Clp protease, protease subunit